MQKCTRFFLLLLFLFFTKPLFSDTTPDTLQKIELKQRQNQTIQTFTLKKGTPPHIFLLHNPDRLVMDFPNTKLSSTIPTDIKSDGLVSRIRSGSGPKGPQNLRLVIDLKAPVQYFYLIDQDPKTHAQKFTVVLTRSTAAKASKKTSNEPDDLADLEQQTSGETLAPLAQGRANLIKPLSKDHARLQNSSLNKVMVVLDPGHGGKDSGAVGPNKNMEKTVVLAIAKKLQALLNASPGIQAKLTRTGDYFIPLRKRLNIARADKADLFVAIHSDAFNESASGASVFALSEHGATSEAARWLADKENTSELSGIDIKTKDKELKSILLDMSQTATIDDSLDLGKDMLRSLANLTRLHSERVEQAGFVVLKSPDIPSVLVETGFISNPTEEKRLIEPAYQDQIAQALATGIIHYFQENPPPDSWFEMNYKSK